jgi:hypothetical protein
MRSSALNDFLLFCNQLRKKSALVRVEGGGGKVMLVSVDGRITGAGPAGLTVKGRGCELWLDLDGAAVERWTPKDARVVTLRPADPGWVSRSTWEIRFRRGGMFLIGELPIPSDR